MDQFIEERKIQTNFFNFSIFRRTFIHCCFRISFRIKPKFRVVIWYCARRRFLQKKSRFFFFFFSKSFFFQITFVLDDMSQSNLLMHLLTQLHVVIQLYRMNYFQVLISIHVLLPIKYSYRNEMMLFFLCLRTAVNWLFNRSRRVTTSERFRNGFPSEDENNFWLNTNEKYLKKKRTKFVLLQVHILLDRNYLGDNTYFQSYSMFHDQLFHLH